MGKYMKTKKGSIESSILEVWQDAAEQTEAERLHRPSYELGTDEYTEYTKNLTPGQEVEQELDEYKVGDPRRAAREKGRKGGREGQGAYSREIGARSRAGQLPNRPAGIGSSDRIRVGDAGKAGKHSSSRGDKKDRTGSVPHSDASAGQKAAMKRRLQKKFGDARARLTKQRDQQMAASYEPDMELLSVLDETILLLTDQLVALNEKGLPPWLDKDKKDDDDDDKKSSKKGNLPPWLKGKGKDKKEALSAKQKKLDVDGDGDIEGDDLADLRNKKKKSESYRARETWKEAIKKVVEYSKDKQEEDEVKGKKTMTGGKKVEVKINPDIEKEEHKKKHVKAGYTY